MARRSRVTRTGCRQSSSLGKASSSILMKRRLAQWLRKEPTALRNQKLLAGYGHWQKRFAGKAPAYPGTAYVLLHSISHALMAEIALDCGYPASSLKERVYALSEYARGRRCRPLRHTYLYRERRRAGHTWRSRRDRPKICAHPQERIGPPADLLK